MAAKPKPSLPISSIAICPLGLLAFTQISHGVAQAPEVEPVQDQAIAKQTNLTPKIHTTVVPPQAIAMPQFVKLVKPLTKTTVNVASTPVPPKLAAPLTLPNLNALPWARIIGRSLGNPAGVINSSLTRTAATPPAPIAQPAILPPPPPPAIVPITSEILSASTPTIAPEIAPTIAPTITPEIASEITAIAPEIAPTIAPEITPAIASEVAPDITPTIEPSITEPAIAPPERVITPAADTFAPVPATIAESLPIPSEQINPAQTPVPSPAQPSVQNPVQSPAQNSVLLPTQVEEAYVLGAGDRVSINILNVPEYSGDYQVLVDGTVNLPVAGSVAVKGLNLQQASEAIVKQYGSELSRFSSVTVNLAASRPLQVAIVGEVGLPGLYTLNNPGGQLPSITQAVQAAGGFTQSANLRQVEIRRSAGQQPQTIKVDLWRLLQGGDQSQNLTLRDGDSIMIPATAGINLSESSQLADSNLGETTAQQVKVALLGEVARPGAYQIESSNTSRLTLTRAVQTAGGITPSADIRQVQIRRFTRDGKEQILTTNLWQLMQSGDLSQDLPLQNGDTITFLKATQPTASETAQLTATNLSASEIQVGLIGELKSPGTLALPANTTLNQALLRGGGFNSRARKSRVELLRMDSSGTLTRRTIELDPKADVNNETNPILQNNDLVVIGPSDRTRITESITNILEPIMRILPPLRFLL